VRIPFALRRAIVAVVFGVIGFVVALTALPNAGAAYENFLLVIAYWIAPWLGVLLADRAARRGTRIAAFLADDARYRNRAGLIAFVVALVVSVVLFSNQTAYVGPFAGSVGDLTPFVGFTLAAVLYVALSAVLRPAKGAALPADGYEEPVHVDAAARA
jgi:NCS1 family nucleobase:cation symporter-1